MLILFSFDKRKEKLNNVHRIALEDEETASPEVTQFGIKPGPQIRPHGVSLYSVLSQLKIRESQ